MTYAESAAFGIVIAIGNADGPPETFTGLNGLHNISGPNWNTRVIEASHHGSATLIKKASFRDFGQISFDLYYDTNDAKHAALIGLHKNKTVKNFEMTITDPGAEKYAFSAFISSMSYRGDVEGFNVYSVTLDLTTDITVS